MKMSKERQIDVEWSSDYTESYPASIQVKSDDRFGLLADVASAISKNKSNILTARTETSASGVGSFYFTLMVESSDQLRKIMADIKKVKKVTTVKRVIRND
jgi:GTP pyrophosphokinase